MRIKKELIILIAIIVLLSLYLILRNRDKTNYTLPVIPVISGDEISRIEIARKDSSILIQKNGDTWVIIPQGYPVAGYVVSNMLEVMEDLTLTTLVSESKNYERYGLSEDNRLTVRVWAGDSLKFEFVIGKKAPSTDHTFVMLPGNYRVYHAQGGFQWKFDQTIEKLRDRSVLSIEESEIQEITITKDGKSLQFIRKQVSSAKDTEEKGAPGKAPSEEKTSWYDAEGKDWDKDKVEGLLNAFADLTCEKYIEGKTKEDFKDPFCLVQIKGKKEYTLSLFPLEGKEGTEYPAISSENAYPFLLFEENAKDILSLFDKPDESSDENES